ncbi:ATP-binding protein [Deinococcus deserti]|uniref:histidine kinase n=1 Tax=Deinococcus deserti (strain DSM 17065 / CIP 109153 / LMG 22923 / VCD115) TaxID=546414 RepID=C1CYN8_DEIDV|nr:ATP-binding protein [Deinococcus deserti]ACO47068.1 putative Signal transduction histidine kinase regulating citrate/malate metabolism [Deinococcus deserti VCD115]
MSLRPASSRPVRLSVPELAREVALPYTPRLLRVQARVFLITLGAFLLLALPLALLASLVLRGGLHQTFADRALRESQLMATLPPVRAALSGDTASREQLNALVNRYRLVLGADYIVITDRLTNRLTHPNPDQIGQRMVGGDFQAFLRGRSLTETVEGTLGPSVRAKVPVLGEGDRVLGLASVGFLLPRVEDVFWNVVRAALPWYLAALGLALLLANLLARRVRATLLDLEPEQVAGGLLHFRTVLNTLQDGVLVVRGGQIYVMNPQARAMLGASNRLPVPLRDLLPDLPAQEDHAPHTLDVRGQPVLVDVHTAEDGAQVVTLRDLARVQALADELTQSRRYAELLRAQTHEFTNRLHMLAGLLHLGETQEALQLIHAQAARHTAHAEAVRRLGHVRLAALLLGKFDRAAELGVELTIDPLSDLPDTLAPGVLDTLELAAGNLIENACEAASGLPDAQVRVLIAADPEGLVLEVRDTGSGVPPAFLTSLTHRGVSSKGNGRGVGLALVQARATALGGTLTHDRLADPTGRQWTRFTLDLPTGDTP